MTNARARMIRMLQAGIPGVKNKKRKLPKAPKHFSLLPLMRRTERDYMRLIEPAFRLVRDNIFPVLQDFKDSEARNRTLDSTHAQRLDDFAGDMQKQFDFIGFRYGEEVPEGSFESTAVAAAKRTNDANKNFNKRTVKTVLGVDPILAEPWLEQEINNFTVENTKLITSISEDLLDDLQGIIQRRVRAGDSTAKLKHEIQKRFGVAENHAQLIARDQTAKLNSSLTENRQRDLGVTKYIWRTSDDGRVRADHEALDDTEQTWANPPITVTKGARAGETNHPGMDIQCRCIAEPVFDDLI